MLNKKNLISINQQFASGKIANGSSLDFVLSHTLKSKNWHKSLCLLTRNILIDHIFEDGNKRTAMAIIMGYLDMNSQHYNPDKIMKLVLKITKSNLNNLNTIGRMIQNATE